MKETYEAYIRRRTREEEEKEAARQGYRTVQSATIEETLERILSSINRIEKNMDHLLTRGVDYDV